MKINRKEVREIVSRLYTLNETKRLMEREIDILKTGLRDLMGESAVLSTGDYVVVRTQRSRKDLNKVALEHDLGPSVYLKYLRVSVYEAMEIKKAAIVKEAL